MRGACPRSRRTCPRFPSRRAPTVQEILAVSPGLQEKGALGVAWNLVANITYHNGADNLVLALAIGCLCLEVAEQKGVDLEDAPGPGWLV